jgi:hypothetical protein
MSTNHSYKTVVKIDNISKSTSETCSQLVFVPFEELNFNENHRHDESNLPSNKREYLLDILGVIGEATIDIIEHYSVHGIANDLSTGDVLDCIEKAITVDFVTESDNDVSDDEYI